MTDLPPIPSDYTLREARLLRGYVTQGDLCVAASVDRSTMSMLERGQVVSRPARERIAKVFGCPYEAVERMVINAAGAKR